MNTSIDHREVDRRIATRHRHVCMVALRVGGAQARSHTLNLSQTGLRLVTDAPLEMGKELELSLSLEPGVSLEIKGTSVWQRPIGSLDTYVVGVHFAPGQDERRGELHSWLTQNDSAA